MSISLATDPSPREGVRPRIAVPTRRCVAPCVDSSLQVTTHSSRNPRCARMPDLHRLGDPRQAGERLVRIAAERRHAHHARQPQRPSGRDPLGQAQRRRPRTRRLVPAPPSGASPRATWTRQPHLATGRRRGPVEGVDQSGAVDRVDDVGVVRHRSRLVRLELTDEVPGEVEVGARRRLRGGLLVAVLADVVAPPARPAAGRRWRERSW